MLPVHSSFLEGFNFMKFSIYVLDTKRHREYTTLQPQETAVGANKTCLSMRSYTGNEVEKV